MEARQLKSREYNTDIFNVRSRATNGANGGAVSYSYAPDAASSEPLERSSGQDPRIFGAAGVPGGVERASGIRTEPYVLAYHSPDNVLYNPEASMAVHASQTHKTYVEPERDLYFHNDPRVPKSRLGEEVFGTRTFDRQAVRQELLPGDKHWLRHADFVRDSEVEGVTPEERKQRELVGQISEHQPVSFARKANDLRTDSLASWKDARTSDKRSNVVREVNTFERRAQELSSAQNPLSASDYSEFTPKTKQQQVHENVEQRVRDALYSDLYGQTGKYGPKPKVAQRSEINSTSGIFSKEGAQKGTRWGEDLSAAERRQDFMRTTGFPAYYDTPTAEPKVPALSDINMARAQLRMPKVVKACDPESRRFGGSYNIETPVLIQDHREINVVSLVFEGLPRDMDADALKAMSGAKHIVRAAVATDNIKNECTGFGEITIRLAAGETKEDIVSRYTAAGITVADKPDAEKRKSNYHELATIGWRDSKLEFAEKRHINTGWETDKLSKVQNLNTNVTMGTNDYLANLGQQYADVIRNRMDNLYVAQQTAENQNQSVYNWDRMRPQTAGASSAHISGEMPFMRTTQSYDTRKKHVIESLRGKYI